MSPVYVGGIIYESVETRNASNVLADPTSISGVLVVNSSDTAVTVSFSGTATGRRIASASLAGLNPGDRVALRITATVDGVTDSHTYPERRVLAAKQYNAVITGSDWLNVNLNADQGTVNIGSVGSIPEVTLKAAQGNSVNFAGLSVNGSAVANIANKSDFHATNTNITAAVWAASAAGYSVGQMGYMTQVVDTVKTSTDTLLTRIPEALFSGITSLANWLRQMMQSKAPDSIAINQINSNGGTFNPTTDSLEALRDRGDTGWITANVSGLSTLDAAGVWAYADRTLSAAVTVDAASITSIRDGLSTLDQAGVQSALTAQGLTAARAGYLDKLNVTGTLAHSLDAATYKADVSGLATSAQISNGVTLAANGLDGVTLAAPVGVPTTLPGQIGQLWMRFLGQTGKDANKIRTYANGQVILEQDYTSDGTNETLTQGVAPTP